MARGVEKQVAAMLEPLVIEMGLELVQVEYRNEGGRWFLRLFIDSEGGVDLDDCSRVSERASARLDEEDPIPHSYTLEVSSPGTHRPLVKDQDFERFRGERVMVKTYGPVRGRRKWEGELLGLEEGEVFLEVDGQQLSIPRDNIAKIHLSPVLPW